MFGYYFTVYIAPILMGIISILLFGVALMAYRWKKILLTKLMVIGYLCPIIGIIIQKMSYLESISEEGIAIGSSSLYATYISTLGMFVGTIALFFFILELYKNKS